MINFLLLESCIWFSSIVLFSSLLSFGKTCGSSKDRRPFFATVGTSCNFFKPIYHTESTRLSEWWIWCEPGWNVYVCFVGVWSKVFFKGILSVWQNAFLKFVLFLLLCVFVCVSVHSQMCAQTYTHTNKQTSGVKIPCFSQWFPADRSELFPQPAVRDSVHGRRTVSQIHIYQSKWCMKGV